MISMKNKTLIYEISLMKISFGGAREQTAKSEPIKLNKIERMFKLNMFQLPSHN